MTTKNRENLIARAIESVLLQSYRYFELIIVNDGSTDKTESILSYYKEKDERIIVLTNDVSRGACYSRNIAIKKSNGQYITGMDDDDQWLPNRISLFVDNIDKLDSFSFLYAGDYFYTPSGREFSSYSKKKYSLKEFKNRNIVGNQVFAKNNVFKNCLFDESMPAAQDYDCFYRMALNFGDGLYLPSKTQILYVDHGVNQITSSPRKYFGYIRFYLKHKSDFSDENRKYQLFTLRLIKNGKITIKDLLVLKSLRNIKRYFFLLRF